MFLFSILLFIEIQSKRTKRWKQSSVIKQLLETMFLAIKMCTDFTTDVIWTNTMRAVSLANHLRAVTDAFHPLTLRARTVFKFLKRCSQFRCTGLLHSSKLVHLDSKNLTCFIQNLVQNLMNLVLPSKNNRK